MKTQKTKKRCKDEEEEKTMRQTETKIKWRSRQNNCIKIWEKQNNINGNETIVLASAKRLITFHLEWLVACCSLSARVCVCVCLFVCVCICTYTARHSHSLVPCTCISWIHMYNEHTFTSSICVLNLLPLVLSNQFFPLKMKRRKWKKKICVCLL